MPTTTKRKPGPQEEAVQARLAAIDADLLDAELVDACLVRARTSDRVASVAASHQAARRQFDVALADPDSDAEELRVLLDAIASWQRAQAAVHVVDIPGGLSHAAAERALAKLTAAPLVVHRPAYLNERDVYRTMAPAWGGTVVGPAVTPDELKAVDGFEAAFAAVAGLQQAITELRSQAARGVTDLLNVLATVGSLRSQRAALADTVAAANKVTAEVDAARVRLGLTWTLPN